MKYKKIAREQISQNEFTAQAVAEATRAEIQTMATSGMGRQGNARIKIRSLILKQPAFNLRAEDKYEAAKLQTGSM